MKSKINARLYDFILSFQEIWKFDKKLLFVLLSDIIVNAVLPFPNIIISALIVDFIVKGDSFSKVILYVTLMFGINFLLTSINTILKKERQYLFLKFTNKLNNEMNNKCMNIDFEQFNDSSFQDRMLLVNQMSQGNNFFTNITTLFDTISEFITLVGIMLIMTTLNIWLLFIMLAVIALQSTLHIIQLKYNKQYQFDTINEQRKLSYMSHLIKGIETKKDIDMFAMGDFILNKVKSFQQVMLNFQKKLMKTSGFIELITYFLSISFQISAYVLLGLNAFTKKISIGDFTMGVTSLINFMSASSIVATNVLNLHDGIFYIRKYKAFNQISSKFDSSFETTINNIDLSNIEIEFRNVWFRYPNSTSFVLKNVNLTIKNKEKLAIVGYNGAGKTSLVLLLTRMYDPTKGTIYLNGIDIKKINYRDYLKIFSTVNQDFSLFAFSLLENIAITDNVPPEKKDVITELFKNNGMEERLQKLYKGLNTPITKTLYASGVDLSGGERQKVAIIRALYKDSPVLILDEPTSALDPEAEHEIYQKFAEIAEGKLTVYISHRIYSTRFCDKIAVLENGEIKEYGTYQELMRLKGLYYDLFEQQAEYFK